MFTVPLAVALLVIAGGCTVAFTVSVNVAVPVPPLLVALIVTVEVAAVEGVPEIKPEVVFTERPAGKPVALKLVGEFDAVIW